MGMKKKKLEPKDWAGEVAFALGEVERIRANIAKAAATKTFKDLPKDDLNWMLPGQGAGGEIPCGRESYQRLHHLAALFLRSSAYADTASLADLFNAFAALVSERFVSKTQEPTLENVETALNDALTKAIKKCHDATHFIPCRLTYAQKPATFHVGPVRFLALPAFNQHMAETFAAYVSSPSDADIKHATARLDKARSYYDAFTWVAEVKILGCAPEISRQRAALAVETAVGVLQLLFGAYHTRRMSVAGSALPDDRRAHLQLTNDGKLLVESSSQATSAVSFEEGWEKDLEREDIAFLVDGAAKVLQPLCDPALKRPLSQRFIDAIAWYGEAVRERTSGSKVVKAVTAIERLVMTGKSKPGTITKTVANRAAMFRCATMPDQDFEALVNEMFRFYDLRSRLAHGDISPFDPVVTELAPSCLDFAEQTLCAGLAFFNSFDVFEQDLPNKQLGQGLDDMVAQVSGKAKQA